MNHDELYHQGIMGQKWGIRNFMDFDDTDNDELYHHGIKGQKWGVRRFQNPDGTLTEAGKKREQKHNEKNARKAVKEDRKWAKKNRSLLSDEELNARINRLQKEKLLRSLTNEELNPGRHEAQKILKNVGTQALSSAVGSMVGGTASSITSNVINERIRKKYNPKTSTYDSMREKADAERRLAMEGYYQKNYDKEGKSRK